MQQTSWKPRSAVQTPPSGSTTFFFDSDNGGTPTYKNSDGTFLAIPTINQNLIPKDVTVNSSHIGRLMVWDIQSSKAKLSSIEGGTAGIALDYRLRVTSTFAAPTSAIWEIKFNNLPSDGQYFNLMNPVDNSIIDTFTAKTLPSGPKEFAIGISISDSADALADLLVSNINLEYDSKTSSSVIVILNKLPCHLGTLGGSTSFTTDGSGTFTPTLNLNGVDNDWNQISYLNNSAFIQTYLDNNNFVNISYDDIFNPSTNGGAGSIAINGRNFPSTIEEQRDMMYNVLYAQLDNSNVPSSRFLFAKNSTNNIHVTGTSLPLFSSDYMSLQYINNASFIRATNANAPTPDLVLKPILGVLKAIIGNNCLIDENVFYSDLIIKAGASAIDITGLNNQQIVAETCLIPYDNGTVIPLKDIWDYNLGSPPQNLYFWFLNYSPYKALNNSAYSAGERTVKSKSNHQFYFGNG